MAIPVGKWGGQFGTMMQQASGIAGMQALKPLILSQLGVTTDEFDQVFVQAITEYDQCQISIPYFLVYGQRPL